VNVRGVRIAGVVYGAAWIAGLAVWSDNTTVSESGAKVVAAYGSSEGPALAQSALTHGLAGLALLEVVLAIAGRVRNARAVLVAGLGAVAISLTQFVLGVLLASWAAPAGHTGSSGALYEAITRLDGLKMFALAGLGLAGAAAIRRHSIAPQWFVPLGWALAAALIVSGLGYVLLVAGLADAAYVSLPLLLVWVCGVGWALRDERPALPTLDVQSAAKI
jgi:hypothetical protein